MEMKFYEFLFTAETGENFNFDDCGENVVVKAENEKEATEIFMNTVDTDYEELANYCFAKEIEDIREYGIHAPYTIWE